MNYVYLNAWDRSKKTEGDNKGEKLKSLLGPPNLRVEGERKGAPTTSREH